MGKLPSTKLAPGAKKAGDHWLRGTDAKAQVFLKAWHIWKSSMKWEVCLADTECLHRTSWESAVLVPFLTVMAFQLPSAWVSLGERPACMTWPCLLYNRSSCRPWPTTLTLFWLLSRPNSPLISSFWTHCFLPPGLFCSQIFHLIDCCLPFESLSKYPDLKEPSRAIDLKE